MVGGGVTIGGLLDLDAIDRLEIAIVPVIVGAGPALAEGNGVHKVEIDCPQAAVKLYCLHLSAGPVSVVPPELP